MACAPNRCWGVTVPAGLIDASSHVRTSIPRQAGTDLWLKASLNSLIQGTDTLQFWSVLGFPSKYYAKFSGVPTSLFSGVPISQGYLHLLPKANTSKTQQPNELVLLNQNALTSQQPCS